MSKPYTFLSASPKDGLYIADVVHALRDRGYDVTAQQLRDYEKAGLFTAEKTQGGFRVYSKAVVANIEFVYGMKLTGMSLRDIKEFCDTEKKIINNPIIKTHKEWDGEKGIFIYIREAKIDTNKANANNQEFIIFIRHYNSVCDEIKNRLSKVRTIAESGMNRLTTQKIGIGK